MGKALCILLLQSIGRGGRGPHQWPMRPDPTVEGLCSIGFRVSLHGNFASVHFCTDCPFPKSCGRRGGWVEGGGGGGTWSCPSSWLLLCWQLCRRSDSLELASIRFATSSPLQVGLSDEDLAVQHMGQRQGYKTAEMAEKHGTDHLVSGAETCRRLRQHFAEL